MSASSAFNRSYYSKSIRDFLQDSDLSILGSLSNYHNHSLEGPQKGAWKKQIEILKQSLSPFSNGWVFFEFAIPRMGKRVDNIVIINDLVFVLEFKVGDEQYQKHALEQVMDYCLDLQNFHEGSHKEKLIPILVATKAEGVNNVFAVENNLYQPLKANQENLCKVIQESLNESNEEKIDAIEWEQSIYKPTPTIIEAAQALYKGHNVKDISRNDAGAINLSITSDCINGIIDRTKSNHQKSICFLTGVPGAGKTLAGLNIANERMKIAEDEHAVFLSGNGPLVDVLREALARDAHTHARELEQNTTKKKEFDRAVKFIQNIHHFRDDNLKTDKAPIEKVVVFDEAQRAWSKEKATSFMKAKGQEDFSQSEPDYLISVMDRHTDWCTIICLIGGGQEINTGEAGVSEWLLALKNNYPNWNIYYSDLILTDDNYLADHALRDWLQVTGTQQTELHLATSIRSFRSEKVSELAHEILSINVNGARSLIAAIGSNFPISITRDLYTAKNWLKKRARGRERIGLVASSGGRRLRPIGIDVKNVIDAPCWFLNNSDDVRSSYYLEDVATEFDIQGLEIDWVCLAWDIDLYFQEDKWHHRYFSGTTWKNVNNLMDRMYLLNAYRVLLTRARQGVIIYIPYGDEADATRPPYLYNQTFEYLKSCGIVEI